MASITFFYHALRTIELCVCTIFLFVIQQRVHTFGQYEVPELPKYQLNGNLFIFVEVYSWRYNKDLSLRLETTQVGQICIGSNCVVGLLNARNFPFDKNMAHLGQLTKWATI